MEEKNFSQELKKILRTKEIKQKELAFRLGVAPPTISNILNGRDRLGKKQAIEWAKVLEIDPIWLMTQGEEGVSPFAEPVPIPINEDVINIPIINIDARGGFLANNEVDVDEYTIDTMPFSRNLATEGDVVIPVFGDSMSPRYPSGSYILIRPLPLWREWLEFGQSYVLELTDQRRTIKIVRKGSTPNTYRLESYNVDYDSTEISINLIMHVFQVLAVVKRETI